MPRAAQKTVFRQNQWGVTAGGPVLLPKVYNGKDKLFWFFTYEGHKNSEPAPTYTTVPTAAERKGDFSELAKLGTNYTLYDPNTAALSGSTVTRQPFRGEYHSANRFNPIAAEVSGLHRPAQLSRQGRRHQQLLRRR